jgi:hypothetical protein
MLKSQLIAQTTPKADNRNVVYWLDYRVTVLTDRLFRIEKSPNLKFRDAATQAVWHRNTEPQQFEMTGDAVHAVIETPVCRLVLYKDRAQCYVEIGELRRSLNNHGNLLGTYRTLDNCNGDTHFRPWMQGEQAYQIQLEKGVCSKTGLAILDDSDSLTLDENGEVKNERRKARTNTCLCMAAITAVRCVRCTRSRAEHLYCLVLRLATGGADTTFIRTRNIFAF